jgi:hypothetical protein
MNTSPNRASAPVMAAPETRSLIASGSHCRERIDIDDVRVLWIRADYLRTLLFPVASKCASR